MAQLVTVGISLYCESWDCNGIIYQLQDFAGPSTVWKWKTLNPSCFPISTS